MTIGKRRGKKKKSSELGVRSSERNSDKTKVVNGFFIFYNGNRIKFFPV